MLSARTCGQTESRTEIDDNNVFQMQVESTNSDHVLAVSGQLDLFASADSRKQLCENDMFASLLHQSGPLPMANTVKSSIIIDYKEIKDSFKSFICPGIMIPTCSISIYPSSTTCPSFNTPLPKISEVVLS